MRLRERSNGGGGAVEALRVREVFELYLREQSLVATAVGNLRYR